MTDDLLYDVEKSDVSPIDQIYNKEFVKGLDKAGSLISMIEGKKINTTSLFLLLMENSSYQNFFVEVTDSEDFKHAILSLLYLHPNLVKSKITKSIIRKYNASHGIRKTPIQQTSCHIKKIKK